MYVYGTCLFVFMSVVVTVWGSVINRFRYYSPFVTDKHTYDKVSLCSGHC